MRSLSVVLADCWLDVRELTSGDRVTHEIAQAAATVRCLVIFLSYEVSSVRASLCRRRLRFALLRLQYLRSVNCTLELLTALRYRGSPQQTIVLLEALGDTTPAASGRHASTSTSATKPLSAAEARGIADILGRSIPGLRIARSVPELIDLIDKHCIRATDDVGITETIEWWAANGTARVNRAPRNTRVVSPLMHDHLDGYWSCLCSCRLRRRGDVAGGFSLVR